MLIKKNNLRQELKQKRQQINERAHLALSQYIIEKIQTLVIFKKAYHIGLYYPIQQEVNILKLIQNQNKQFYLPRINSQNMLQFHQIIKLDDLITGQYGIPEPQKTNVIGTPDLLIIPMLGFDIDGHRLGYGQGHYDRYLNTIQKPFCLGVAFDIQQVPYIPHEPHDIDMDLIVTDKKIVKCKDLGQ